MTPVVPALTALAALLSAATATGWAWGQPRRLALIAATLLALVAWTVGWAGVAPADLPIELLSPRQEGLTGTSIEHLFGVGVHAGASFPGQWLPLLPAGTPIRSIIWGNCWVTGINVVLLLAASLAISGRWWLGPALAVGLALSASPWRAALSEGPAPLLSLYVLLGIPLAGWGPGRGIPRLIGVALLGLLATELRAEWMAVAAVTTGVAALRARFSDARLRAFEGAALRWLRQLPSRPALSRRVLLGAVIWLVVRAVLPTQDWYGTAALDPLNPAPLALPAALAGQMPLLLALATSGAVVVGLLRWRETLGLPLGLLTLWKAYVSSSHGGAAPDELERYGDMLVLGLVALVPLVPLELGRLAARRGWPAGWRPLALTACLGTASLVWSPWLLSVEGEAHAIVGPAEGTQSEEFRYLLGAYEANPGCTWVARTAGRSNVPTQQLSRPPSPALLEPTWMVFGGGRDRPERLDPAVTDPLAELDADCVMAFWGADCSLERATICATPEDLPDEEQLGTRAFYRHVRHVPPVRVGIQRLR